MPGASSRVTANCKQLSVCQLLEIHLKTKRLIFAYKMANRYGVDQVHTLYSLISLVIAGEWNTL